MGNSPYFKDHYYQYVTYNVGMFQYILVKLFLTVESPLVLAFLRVSPSSSLTTAS